MTSKMESMGQTLVMEHDKAGNFHQTISIQMAAHSIKVESIIFDKKMFTKKNDEEWQPQPLDSIQMESLKNQWQNNQLQFFKNCKKLDNEITDGKNYRVYTGDFDAEQMKALMSKSAQTMPNSDLFSKMDMKTTFYVNDKDDLERAKLKMDMNGQSFDTVMVYEYDIDVTVKPPPPAAKKD